MEIFTFGKKVGQVINHFDSTFIMTKILNTKAEVRMNCMHLAEGGIIGYHKAVVPQLLLVVQGEGCVRGISGNLWLQLVMRCSGKKGRDMKQSAKQV